MTPGGFLLQGGLAACVGQFTCTCKFKTEEEESTYEL